MPKDYRCTIAAIVVYLVLIGAGPAPGGDRRTHQSATRGHLADQRPATDPAAPKTDVTPSPDPGCPDRKDDRHSDLCAQWKAADAAADASWWAMAAFYLGVAGTAGLLLSIHYTRRAVAAAAVANTTAREGIEAEKAAQRPWVIYDRLDVPWIRQAANQPPVSVAFWMKWRNYGTSPAFQCYSYQEYKVVPIEAPPPVFNREVEPPATYMAVGPGGEASGYPIRLTPQEYSDLCNNRVKVFYYNRIMYRDQHTLDKLRVSENCLCIVLHGSKTLNNGEVVPDFGLHPQIDYALTT